MFLQPVTQNTWLKAQERDGMHGFSQTLTVESLLKDLWGKSGKYTETVHLLLVLLVVLVLFFLPVCQNFDNLSKVLTKWQHVVNSSKTWRFAKILTPYHNFERALGIISVSYLWNTLRFRPMKRITFHRYETEEALRVHLKINKQMFALVKQKKEILIE